MFGVATDYLVPDKSSAMGPAKIFDTYVVGVNF
jgi:hypothetical protein